MSTGRRRSLVIESEAAIQRFTVAALTEQGFDCHAASDGTEAVAKLETSTYDVLIVDLKMPNQQGRPLALDLIQHTNRPLVVVQTDMIEPQLAQELIARGVDDVFIKPIDYGTLASKVRSLVDNRDSLLDLGGGAAVSKAAAADVLAAESALEGRVSLACLNQKLGEVSRVLPISAAALDVYEMTKSIDWDLSQIAAAVQRDASLTTEVLRMANSAYYNPPGRPIVNIDEAVMRIGQKRVGELALSINALSAVTPAMIPWMDLDLTWNRSMASGIALELLVDLGGHDEVADGLFVSAIMHPLGRIVLAMLFPEPYSAMLAECAATGNALQELEQRTFPTSHTDVMAQLLADWRLAPEVFLPLKFSMDSYASIARLLEPMRTKAELVKVAILVGRLAVGYWESWDFVQFPPTAVLNRLRLHEIEQLIRQTESDATRLAEFRPGGKPACRKTVRLSVQAPVAYCNLTGHDADLFKEFLPALDLEPHTDATGASRQRKLPRIVNCLGTDAANFTTQRLEDRPLIVTDQAKCDAFAQFGPTLGLPDSFHRVREKLLAHVAECARVSVAG